MGFSFALVQLRITQNEAVVARSSRFCRCRQSLRPMPAQSPITMDIMADILTTVDTGGDTVDTMDTPTDTGSVKPKLHPLPLLLPLLMLMPMPLLTTTDTTDIPTDTEDIMVDITV